MKRVRTEVGTGVTAHARVVHHGLTGTELTEFYSGYIDATIDFPIWLDRYEQSLVEIAELARIPSRPCSLIAFDGRNRNSWDYASVNEAKRIIGDEIYRSKHKFEQPCVEHVTHYLMEENASGWQWGYQSFGWYIGKEMRLLNWCRDALRDEQWFRLAALSFELGEIGSERRIKFKADHIIDEANRRAEKARLGEEAAKLREGKIDAGQQNGHKAQHDRSVAWKTDVDRIWLSSMEIQQATKATEVRCAILDRWPRPIEKGDPPLHELYRYVREKLKREKLKSGSDFSL